MPRKKRPPIPDPVIRPLAPRVGPANDTSPESSPASLFTPASTSRRTSASSQSRHAPSAATYQPAEQSNFVLPHRPVLSPCGVPQCARLNCNLPTHIAFAKQLKLSSGRKDNAASSSPSSAESSEVTIPYEPRLAGHAKLPLETADARLIKIFQEFFSGKFEEVVLTFRPPVQMDTFKARHLRLALENRIYCLCCIAQGYIERQKDQGRRLSTGDELTAMIYGNLVEGCREVISDTSHSVDSVVLAIVQLCQFDLNFNRKQQVRQHYSGLKALVRRQGGLHNLNQLSLPYVSRMDRRVAIYENEVPELEISATPQIAAQPATLSSREPQRTGVAFATATHPAYRSLSSSVRKFCIDAAHITELMSDLKISYDPSEAMSSQRAGLTYFYYLRENVDARHAVLAPRLAKGEVENATANDALVVGAAKIVTYVVTQANYLPMMTILVAERLWDTLLPTLYRDSSKDKGKGKKRHDDNSRSRSPDLTPWLGNLELLLWLLYSCAIAYTNNPYALSSSQLERYNSIVRWILRVIETLRSNGSDREQVSQGKLVLGILNRFVWSERLREGFGKITASIGRLVAEQVAS